MASRALATTFDSRVYRLAPGGVVEEFFRNERGINGLAVDKAGNLLISDSLRLRMVERTGNVRTLAGCLCSGDGGHASFGRVGSTAGLVRDASGNVYFSDPDSHVVRRIAADGTLDTIAGDGDPGFSGDGGAARQARLNSPAGLALDQNGNLYIADEGNYRVRRVSAAGIITPWPAAAILAGAVTAVRRQRLRSATRWEWSSIRPATCTSPKW